LIAGSPAGRCFVRLADLFSVSEGGGLAVRWLDPFFSLILWVWHTYQSPILKG